RAAPDGDGDARALPAAPARRRAAPRGRAPARARARRRAADEGERPLRARAAPVQPALLPVGGTRALVAARVLGRRSGAGGRGRRRDLVGPQAERALLDPRADGEAGRAGAVGRLRPRAPDSLARLRLAGRADAHP